MRKETHRHALPATFLLLASAAALATAGAAMGEPDALDDYNVVWTAPSKDSSGSVPLGNGEIGVNAWVEENGDLLFYLSRTDAWSEHARLLKLGRVRVKLSPNPFAAGMPFRQALRLRQGEIVIVAGRNENAVALRLWVDAHRPVVVLEAESREPFDLAASLEVWRTQPRTLKTVGFGGEGCGVDGLTRDDPPTESADVVMPNAGNQLVWYHRNEYSLWPATLKLQGLEGLMNTLSDPLLHRTFGGAVMGSGLVRRDAQTLGTAGPVRRCIVSIHSLTARTDSAAAWQRTLDEAVASTGAADLEAARAAHQAWWREFWGRSWIHVSEPAATRPTSSPAFVVSRGYALQRFVTACGGRGAYPIKFNGSIFTVDSREPNEVFNADYRRWGGAYWWQNTRFPYWAMPAAGDFDLMQPLFRMYRDLLPLAEARTRIYYGHDGAFFPETQYFWGTYWNGRILGYGWEREGMPLGQTINQYIRYYWQGGIELAAMMLDAYAITQDRQFAKSTLVPVAHSVATFYEQHWKRDAAGKIRFEPSQSLETWWQCVNPMPEVAGLRVVLNGLICLPEDLTTPAQRDAWRKTLADLPDVPRKTEGGRTFLLPAATFANKQNQENPELYAVFPYRLYGVGKPDLPVALETWNRRLHKAVGCWQQDAIHAACLGLADEAAQAVTNHFGAYHAGSRFPAFWGPNFDWLPDQDHGGVAVVALQSMLMQCDGKTIRLLPAWPREWDVQFKLHAPPNTTVEGAYRKGHLEGLKVVPESRARDIVIADSPSPRERR